jgi:hypothetical protein
MPRDATPPGSASASRRFSGRRARETSLAMSLSGRAGFARAAV